MSRILTGRLFPEQKQRKLTEEQVQDVRYIGEGSITEAARKYGIRKFEAAAIVQERSYRDVPLSDRQIERRILFLRLEAELAAIPSI